MKARLFFGIYNSSFMLICLSAISSIITVLVGIPIGLFLPDSLFISVWIFLCSAVVLVISCAIFSLCDDKRKNTIEGLESRKLSLVCTRNEVMVLNLTEFETKVLEFSREFIDGLSVRDITRPGCSISLKSDSYYVVPCGIDNRFVFIAQYEKPLSHEHKCMFGLWRSCSLYESNTYHLSIHLDDAHMMHALAH